MAMGDFKIGVSVNDSVDRHCQTMAHFTNTTANTKPHITQCHTYEECHYRIIMKYMAIPYLSVVWE